MRNKRKQVRRQVSEWPAEVMADTLAPTKCAILDISETGARIKISEACELPPEFRLAFGAKGPVRNCLLVWQDAGVAGLLFNDRRDKSKQR